MKKLTVPKIIGIVTGIYAVCTAVAAIKKQAEEQMKREADAEAKITAVIEAKFANRHAEDEEEG